MYILLCMSSTLDIVGNSGNVHHVHIYSVTNYTVIAINYSYIIMYSTSSTLDIVGNSGNVHYVLSK